MFNMIKYSITCFCDWVIKYYALIVTSTGLGLTHGTVQIIWPKSKYFVFIYMYYHFSPFLSLRQPILCYRIVYTDIY